MQLCNFLEQLIGLIRWKSEFFDVRRSGSVLFEAVVAELGLYRVWAEQGVCDEWTRQSEASDNKNTNAILVVNWTLRWPQLCTLYNFVQLQANFFPTLR